MSLVDWLKLEVPLLMYLLQHMSYHWIAWIRLLHGHQCQQYSIRKKKKLTKTVSDNSSDQNLRKIFLCNYYYIIIIIFSNKICWHTESEVISLKHIDLWNIFADFDYKMVLVTLWELSRLRHANLSCGEDTSWWRPELTIHFHNKDVPTFIKPFRRNSCLLNWANQTLWLEKIKLLSLTKI